MKERFPDNHNYGINDNAVRYWSQTGYRRDDIDRFCEQHDHDRHFALIVIQNGLLTNYTISKRCDISRQGHFPAVLRFFAALTAQEILSAISGAFVVWLEDGLHEFEYNLGQRIPLFVFGRSRYDHCSLLIPDPAFTESFGYRETLQQQAQFESTVPFSSRRKTIFWRGAASGVNYHDIQGWRSSPRGKLVLASKALSKPDVLDARFTKVEGWSKVVTDDIYAEEVGSRPCPFNEFLQYRYLADADGISCAWISLFRKLASSSVVVKMESSVQQWYYDRLEPWRHYVPLNVNLADVERVWQWLNKRPDECERIASRAQELIKSLTFEREVEQTARLVRKIADLRID